jgi:hypothetical protein
MVVDKPVSLTSLYLEILGGTEKRSVGLAIEECVGYLSYACLVDPVDPGSRVPTQMPFSRHPSMSYLLIWYLPQRKTC